MKIEIADLNIELQHEEAVRLIEEYSESLGMDFCFQNFEKELNDLTKLYSPNNGQSLFLKDKSKCVGFVAVKKLEDQICEMKRLYIKPYYRNQGWGRKMAKKIMDESKRMGYKFMRLDTLASLVPAIELYKRLGFKEIKAYYENPLDEVVYFEKELK